MNRALEPLLDMAVAGALLIVPNQDREMNSYETASACLGSPESLETSKRL